MTYVSACALEPGQLWMGDSWRTIVACDRGRVLAQLALWLPDGPADDDRVHLLGSDLGRFAHDACVRLL